MKLAVALGVLLVCVSFSRAQIDYGIGCIHRLNVTQDVALEKATTNHNPLPYLIVGKHPQYPNQRSLLQFQNLDNNVCGLNQIVWAKMYVYYANSHKFVPHSNQQTPWRSRPIQVYQVKKQWNEAQATSTRRTTGNNWSQAYLSLSGTDAGPGVIDTVTIHTARPRGFVEFDVTSAVRNWASGKASNHGVLLRATNEQDEGRTNRFSSNAEADSSRHAFINVLCQCQKPASPVE